MADHERPEASTSIDLSSIPIEEPEEGVFSAYANIINADWTLYDIRIRFGELIQVPNDNDPSWVNQHGIVLERVAVTLPWHQAKHLCNLLGSIIQNYEAINGELTPIKLPAPPSPPGKA
jgi:Protein of unknown function (DUF3467)